jgi:hypothetical protein
VGALVRCAYAPPLFSSLVGGYFRWSLRRVESEGEEASPPPRPLRGASSRTRHPIPPQEPPKEGTTTNNNNQTDRPKKCCCMSPSSFGPSIMDEACASHVAVSDVTRGNSMINLRRGWSVRRDPSAPAWSISVMG